MNFDGPIIFCVVSRYHGGAFVVFSQRLNPGLEAVAVEGARASVIGGAPAAAVVFARDVEQTARGDARIVALDARIERADSTERQGLRAERAELWAAVLSQTRGEFAAEFDRVHSVERAERMGFIDRIVAPAALRPFLVDAVERGMARSSSTRGARMSTPRWLTRCHADVPADDGGRGRRAARARRPADRAAPRLLASRTLDCQGRRERLPGRCRRNASRSSPRRTGRPRSWVSGERAAVSLSLSHRAGRALAVVAAAPTIVGCDLELVEPRSGAFIREWLAAPEQALVAGLAGVARDRIVNGLWTAKEAVAKVRREGLRLDVRHAVVDVPPPGPGWRALRVQFGGRSTAGWWRDKQAGQ